MKAFVLTFAACGVLGGCGMFYKLPEPRFVEPDPNLMPTARLRIVVPPGVNAEVALYKNNIDGMCLKDREPAYLPVDTSSSGFPQSHTKKIGMPLGDTPRGKIGTEMYIPVATPVAIGARFSGNTGSHIQICESAFRFQPIANRDYQIYVIPGLGGGSGRAFGCLIEAKEIPENHPANKELPNVEVQQIAVRTSPAWNQLCADVKAGP